MKSNNKGINPVVAAVAAGAVVATGVVGAILMSDKDNQKKVKDAMNDVKGKVEDAKAKVGEHKENLENKAHEIKGKVEEKAAQVGGKVEKVMDAVKEPMANGKK
jgi:hypothetical protein